jgi:hypothetical protein
MTFNSSEQLKQYILSRLQNVIQEEQDKIYRVLDECLKRYYSEFDPAFYERTYQFLHSLVRTNIVSTGNGYRAYVYFDYGSLDYSYKSFSSGINPFNPKQQSLGGSNWFANPKGDGYKVVLAASEGTHGGYCSGTSTWKVPIQKLLSEFSNDIKASLEKNGIPIK